MLRGFFIASPCRKGQISPIKIEKDNSKRPHCTTVRRVHAHTHTRTRTRTRTRTHAHTIARTHAHAGQQGGNTPRRSFSSSLRASSFRRDQLVSPSRRPWAFPGPAAAAGKGTSTTSRARGTQHRRRRTRGPHHLLSSSAACHHTPIRF